MTRGLVSAGIQAEVDHEGPQILGGLDIGPTIVERNVGVVETSGEVAVDGNTVSLDGEGVDGAGHDVDVSADGGGAEDGPARGGADGGNDDGDGLGGGGGGDGLNGELAAGGADEGVADQELGGERSAGTSDDAGGGDRHGRLGQGKGVGDGAADRGEGGAGDLAEAVPLVEVLGLEHRGRGGVILDLHADEEGLDGPLELLKQDLAGALIDRRKLLSVDADEGEADAFNTFFPRYDSQSQLT